MQNVTLDTLGGGALAELFAEEFAKVLANIADPNTDATARRSISISVSLKPNKDRDTADVELSCSSKVAGISTVATRLFMGRQHGKLVAVENDPRQKGLFDEPKPTLVAGAGVSPFPGAQQERSGE